VLLPNGDVPVPSGARTPELLDSGAPAFRLVGGGFPSGCYFATTTLLENGDVLIVGGYGIRSAARPVSGASSRSDRRVGA
jgi:hypothetical protein